MRRHLLRLFVLVACLIAGFAIFALALNAQNAPVLVTQAVDNSVRSVLSGNVHPFARAEFDRGEAPPDLPLNRMLLVLKRSPQQESALRSFIDSQQDSRTPSFHKWLTPEQFGATYGPADSDIAAVVNWLKASGFEVAGINKGRTVIEFSGSAALVKQAFGAPIHKYVVDGEKHWANSVEPQIPQALAPVIVGIDSLHNFPRKTHHTVSGPITPFYQSPIAPLPLYTFKYQGVLWYGVGPSDFATIYNVQPLWNSGIDGTGQTIAIVGESNINVQDVRDFRRIFGLPANDPQVILNGLDPGLQADETEAVLDVSWSGAVAKQATIDFVVSASTNSTAGVDLSALYIVENNLAPVMSESYGECEAFLGNAGNAFYQAVWQEAAVQGITVLISAGDGGSAGCDNFNSQSVAYNGLAMSGFASTPYNVAVGGTDFDQTPQTAPNYWNSTNNNQTGASAKSYIRETTWNESCAIFGLNGCTPSNFNFLDIVAGSGGPSSCSTKDDGGTCQSGYLKPAWQTGTNVPLDGVRDTPDVSLFASPGFNGSFYILCEADQLQGYPCSIGTNYSFLGIGGTSASSPAFAGIMALVNQKTSSRQGNANYVLYKLAAQNGASCNSSTVALTGNSCIFYDTTKGVNSVPCIGTDCGAAPAGGYGILVDSSNNPAWTTNTGYDMATGLGSVNVANLVNKWTTATFTQSVTTLTTLSPLTFTHGQPVNVSVSVAPKTGTGTPTGTVALMASPNGKPLSVDDYTLANGVATWTTNLLPGGSYNVTAHYAGDGVYGGSDSTGMQVTVAKEDSQATTSLDANGILSTSALYGSSYSLRTDLFSKAQGTHCLPNPLGESACPTGTVSYTDNGTALNIGPFTLNNQGYAESPNVQLTGGAHTLGAQYSGDNSFNPSTTSQSITITPAPDYLYAFPTYSLGVGQPLTVDARVNTWSLGVAPTGTVTFSSDGNTLPGTPVLTPQDGGPGQWASLDAVLNTSIDSPGNHTITITYSGDGNYAGPTSFAWTLDALYTPAYFTLAANPQSVAYGGTVTLTAIVGTSSNKLAPTGQVGFQTSAGESLSGTLTYSTITDNSGNLALQAVLTYTPQYGQTVTAYFNGDTNYSRATSNQTAVGVTGGTFTIQPVQAVNIASPGASGVAYVNLAPASGFTGTITVSCMPPANMKEATCPSVTANIVNTYPVTAYLTITTHGPHQVSVRPLGGALYQFGLFAAVFVLAIPRVRRRKLAMALLLLMIVVLIVSCGGGGSGGGGTTDPGTPVGSYTVALTATGGGITQTANVMVNVQ